MRLEEFAYDLPEELIAQHPLPRRDQARLMVVNRARQSICHDVFASLPRYLPQQAHVILNDTKVIPARLFGRRATGARVEIFLLKEHAEGLYEVLLKPLRKLKEGETLSIEGGTLTATLVDRARRLVRFNRKDARRYLRRLGHMPLPPYITREDTAVDRSAYQTVFARRPGSVASPTAGLHFTRDLLERLRRHPCRLDRVTLHVNYGTFKPVEENDITRHVMHSEDYRVSATVFKRLAQSRRLGRSVVAVGTTSCRVLETLANGGELQGSTSIFMYPGYVFKMTDILITNFHLPYSTLLMLVYAFGGTALMKRAYQEAIQQRYRFYSYGDGMVIL